MVFLSINHLGATPGWECPWHLAAVQWGVGHMASLPKPWPITAPRTVHPSVGSRINCQQLCQLSFTLGTLALCLHDGELFGYSLQNITNHFPKLMTLLFLNSYETGKHAIASDNCSTDNLRCLKEGGEACSPKHSSKSWALHVVCRSTYVDQLPNGSSPKSSQISFLTLVVCTTSWSSNEVLFHVVSASSNEILSGQGGHNWKTPNSK